MGTGEARDLHCNHLPCYPAQPLPIGKKAAYKRLGTGAGAWGKARGGAGAGTGLGLESHHRQSSAAAARLSRAEVTTMVVRKPQGFQAASRVCSGVYLK